MLYNSSPCSICSTAGAGWRAVKCCCGGEGVEWIGVHSLLFNPVLPCPALMAHQRSSGAASGLEEQQKQGIPDDMSLELFHFPDDQSGQGPGQANPTSNRRPSKLGLDLSFKHMAPARDLGFKDPGAGALAAKGSKKYRLSDSAIFSIVDSHTRDIYGEEALEKLAKAEDDDASLTFTPDNTPTPFEMESVPLFKPLPPKQERERALPLPLLPEQPMASPRSPSPNSNGPAAGSQSPTHDWAPKSPQWRPQSPQPVQWRAKSPEPLEFGPRSPNYGAQRRGEIGGMEADLRSPRDRRKKLAPMASKPAMASTLGDEDSEEAAVGGSRRSSLGSELNMDTGSRHRHHMKKGKTESAVAPTPSPTPPKKNAKIPGTLNPPKKTPCSRSDSDSAVPIPSAFSHLARLRRLDCFRPHIIFPTVFHQLLHCLIQRRAACASLDVTIFSLERDFQISIITPLVQKTDSCNYVQFIKKHLFNPRGDIWLLQLALLLFLGLMCEKVTLNTPLTEKLFT